MFGASGPNGLEMMLRNLGLSSVLDAAKQIAESGAVPKILKFAEDVEGINARLSRIERHLGIAGETVLIEGTAELRRTDANAGSGPRTRDVA